MTDAHAYLSAITDMATGVLNQHGSYDDETGVSHGPANHIAFAGGVLDEATRTQLLDGGAPLRGGAVDTMMDNSSEGVFLAVGRFDSEDGDEGDGVDYDLDIFVPLTASVVEAHAIVKTALDEYVAEHFAE